MTPHCQCAAKLKRLEQQATRIEGLLEALVQVMSNDWHASDPAAQHRRELQRRMAHAHITGVAR